MKIISAPEIIFNIYLFKVEFSYKFMLWLLENNIKDVKIVDDPDYVGPPEHSYLYQPFKGLALEFLNDQDATLFALRWS